jgi:glutamate-1-semialdehyde 2,1-aminomutase
LESNLTDDFKQEFSRRAPSSEKIFHDAREVLAGGMTHESRHVQPFPIAVERAAGSRKWDVDGSEYVDFVMGHGALLLGHGHPAVVEALREQAGRGTHYGSAHRGEVEWAELIRDLIPTAERVRFTSSGTEAVMLAIRTARAVTGRPKVLKFDHHFHGWSEIGLIALLDPVEIPVSPGLPPGATEAVVSIDPHDLKGVEEKLASKDFAAVIVEPSGARMGQHPLPDGLLNSLRKLTTDSETLLIFDEVVTGFRWSEGGAQKKFGILPDLTTLGKIMGGGLPAGALAGPADKMDLFDIRDPQWTRHQHLFHPGTFNANPLCAAAGIATLNEVSSGEPNQRADANASELRDGLRKVLGKTGVEGHIGGDSSVVFVHLGPAGPKMDRELSMVFRTMMLSNGVDFMNTHALVSAVHTAGDFDLTCSAFEKTIQGLNSLGMVSAT